MSLRPLTGSEQIFGLDRWLMHENYPDLIHRELVRGIDELLQRALATGEVDWESLTVSLDKQTPNPQRPPQMMDNTLSVHISILVRPTSD